MTSLQSFHIRKKTVTGLNLTVCSCHNRVACDVSCAYVKKENISSVLSHQVISKLISIQDSSFLWLRLYRDISPSNFDLLISCHFSYQMVFGIMSSQQQHEMVCSFRIKFFASHHHMLLLSMILVLLGGGRHLCCFEAFIGDYMFSTSCSTFLFLLTHVEIKSFTIKSFASRYKNPWKTYHTSPNLGTFPL